MEQNRLKAYYYLTKPGIIYANAITAIAGYLYGSKWHIHFASFSGVIIGTSLVIAGACVYNNLLDRKIDKKMKRTSKRSLVTGEISLRFAAIYATILVLGGLLLLRFTTNLTVVCIGIIGLVDYVILYGWAKRHTPYSTIIGSISGATSVIAGSVAATNGFNAPELMLFLLLVIWQMPHFYCIAMYRYADYASAALPVMPVVKTVATAKRRIMLWIGALVGMSALFTLWGYGGIISFVLLGGLSTAWLIDGLKNYYKLEPVKWGKRMFLFSLVVNLGLSLTIAISSVTP